MKKFTVLTCFILLIGCAAKVNNMTHNNPSEPPLNPTTLSEAEALATFAKLYGYSRYFHPTDEALALNWDQFLVYGIKQIKTNNGHSLQEKLTKLFAPISQNLEVYHKNQQPNRQARAPLDGQQLKMWQHIGLGEDSPALYASSRMGDSPKTPINPIFTYIMGDDYNNHQYKLTAQVKVNAMNPASGDRIYLSAHGYGRETFSEDYQKHALITKNQWQTHQVTGTFDQPTRYILFGAELIGTGKMWVDDFTLSVSLDGKNWQEVSIINNQFDKPDPNLPAKNWSTISDKFYTYKISSEEDNNVMLIESIGTQVPGQIFELAEHKYTVVQKPLNQQLMLSLPTTVWDAPETELSDAFLQLESDLTTINMDELTAEDVDVRIANIIKLWNVIQHYYPYFDVVDTNWESLLVPAIEQATHPQSTNQHDRALNQLLANTEDGHGAIYHKNNPIMTGVPIRVEVIEDQLVVTASRIDEIKKGDLIIQVDGIAAMTYLADQKTYVSGSPHLRELRTLNQFGIGDANTDIQLTLKRDTRTISHIHTRNADDARLSNIFFNGVTQFDFPDIKEIEPGIFYVNLFTTSQQEFIKYKPKLATAKGIIFDRRWDGQSFNGQNTISDIRDLLPHLITSEVSSPRWLTPNLTLPDQADMKFSKSGWDIAPKAPYFGGKKAIIIVPSVVSSGETFTSMIDHYELAELVGHHTAGCNGNINYIKLIGGFQAMFTGMKVVKHDESQLHLIGYEPHNYVTKTINGVLNNQDEFLKKALETVRAE